MRYESSFYKRNLERLRSFIICPECLKESLDCHHYDYIKEYIKELEEKPPLESEKFNIFWEEYPRKIARKTAESYWMKANIDEKLFEKIMKSLEAQKKSRQWKSENGKYIPHPATWINQERWNDEIQSIPNKYDLI